MAEPNAQTREELSAVIQAFLDKLGKFPARDDFKGERRTYYENLLGISIPHAIKFERTFGSWSEVRKSFGVGESKFTPNQLAEKVSIDYAVKQLGMVEVQSETGTVDGFIGNQRVEVKGNVLSRASASDKHANYRFRWPLHYRKYSQLVDRMVLVGVLRNGEIAMVLDVQGQDQITDLFDDKKTFDFTVNTLFGQRESKFWPFITQINSKLNADNIEDYV